MKATIGLLVFWNLLLTALIYANDDMVDDDLADLASHIVESHREIHNQIMIREAKFNLVHPDFDHVSFHETWVIKGQ